jgi:hypothetical protein
VRRSAAACRFLSQQRGGRFVSPSARICASVSPESLASVWPPCRKPVKVMLSGKPAVFDFGNIVAQANNATQVGVALGGTSGITGGNAGNASVAQLLDQANVSSIS